MEDDPLPLLLSAYKGKKPNSSTGRSADADGKSNSVFTPRVRKRPRPISTLSSTSKTNHLNKPLSAALKARLSSSRRKAAPPARSSSSAPRPPAVAASPVVYSSSTGSSSSTSAHRSRNLLTPFVKPSMISRSCDTPLLQIDRKSQSAALGSSRKNLSSDFSTESAATSSTSPSASSQASRPVKRRRMSIPALPSFAGSKPTGDDAGQSFSRPLSSPPPPADTHPSSTVFSTPSSSASASSVGSTSRRRQQPSHSSSRRTSARKFSAPRPLARASSASASSSSSSRLLVTPQDNAIHAEEVSSSLEEEADLSPEEEAAEKRRLLLKIAAAERAVEKDRRTTTSGKSLQEQQQEIEELKKLTYKWTITTQEILSRIVGALRKRPHHETLTVADVLEKFRIPAEKVDFDEASGTFF